MSASTAHKLNSATVNGSREDSFLGYRRVLILFSQTALIVVTYYFAFLLTSDFHLDGARQLMWTTLPIVLLVKLPLFYRFGLLSGWWRYVGMSDLLDISVASTTSGVLLYLLFFPILHVGGYPLAALIIDLMLTICVTGGARFAVRAYTERASRTFSTQQTNTLVVGAGRAGGSIVRELQRNGDLDLNPVGFVDDDVTKHGLKIHGVKVLGTTDDIEVLIKRHAVQCVLLAAPSVHNSLVERVVAKCRECKVTFKILPAIRDRLNGASSVNQLRNVSVEDLLGREPVYLELENIREKLQGRVALITGAAGSIGSELARQIANFCPRKLVLFERSENDLFHLANELSEKFPYLDFVPVVGDILDVGVLRDTFSLYRPHSVFHAAAYKHVPMMERNCFQAVTNNVFGTYNVALVASQYDVDDFVMISSDKAVNPTNIMGVTKRVAELIILGLQHQRTRFMAVRFGNVLGSNGSVLPTFQEQIARGGPVTVTHPEATRYFMTIPEAVQLVLQASTMGVGGEVFVLNMGEPVKIVDLARNLIRLCGKAPDADIPIIFTGLRPGEKLYEELMFEGEGLKPTSHEKIRVLDCGRTNFSYLSAWLDDLSAVVEAKNVSALISRLRGIVPEYTPSPEVLTLCEVDRHDRAWRYKHERASLDMLRKTA